MFYVPKAYKYMSWASRVNVGIGKQNGKLWDCTTLLCKSVNAVNTALKYTNAECSLGVPVNVYF